MWPLRATLSTIWKKRLHIQFLIYTRIFYVGIFSGAHTSNFLCKTWSYIDIPNCFLFSLPQWTKIPVCLRWLINFCEFFMTRNRMIFNFNVVLLNDSVGNQVHLHPFHGKCFQLRGTFKSRFHCVSFLTRRTTSSNHNQAFIQKETAKLFLFQEKTPLCGHHNFQQKKIGTEN